MTSPHEQALADTRCNYCKANGFQYPNLCEDCRLAALPAPDLAEWEKMADRLRERAQTRNTGSPVASDDYSTMGYYSVGSAEFDRDLADRILSLVRALAEARMATETQAKLYRQALRRAKAAEAELAEIKAKEAGPTLRERATALIAELGAQGIKTLGDLMDRARKETPDAQ